MTTATDLTLRKYASLGRKQVYLVFRGPWTPDAVAVAKMVAAGPGFPLRVAILAMPGAIDRPLGSFPGPDEALAAIAAAL